MNILEEAIIYATIMHQGAKRKITGVPYILHPIEVAQIIGTMTDDLEVITAGVLHDIVEDTDGTIDEIQKRFGPRVALLVNSESEYKYDTLAREETWVRRKEDSIAALKATDDKGIKMLWLADKLSNMRSLAGAYREQGDAMWNSFNQKDPSMHRWYYQTIAECLELDFNKTGAYKELIEHINFVWPGSFSSEKSKYKKYKEISVEGCEIIGKGAKGTVYRLNDELIAKVYNGNNTYKEIERENELARKAFIAGIPTAISFGIVAVEDKFASVFELLNSNSVSECISRGNDKVYEYADLMADLARQIHTTDGAELELPNSQNVAYEWVNEGLVHVDSEIAGAITKMIDALPQVTTMVHGDFHTGNVMMEKDEALLIDMDGLSICHPIIELCGIYMFYVGFGEINPEMIESFMGFSCEIARKYYDRFMRSYLGTSDEKVLQDVENKAALLCYVRLVRRVYKKGLNLSESKIKERDYYISRIKDLLKVVDSFDFNRVV